MIHASSIYRTTKQMILLLICRDYLWDHTTLSLSFLFLSGTLACFEVKACSHDGELMSQYWDGKSYSDLGYLVVFICFSPTRFAIHCPFHPLGLEVHLVTNTRCFLSYFRVTRLEIGVKCPKLLFL